MTRANPLTQELHRLRAEIDALNHEILVRLEQRAELVHAIGDIKEALELPGHDPRREEEMLRKLVREAKGHLAESDVRAIFGAIFGVGLELQRRRSERGESEGGAS